VDPQNTSTSATKGRPCGNSGPGFFEKKQVVSRILSAVMARASSGLVLILQCKFPVGHRPVLARMPGALRNGAPFEDWPIASQSGARAPEAAGFRRRRRQMVKRPIGGAYRRLGDS
jgi:hypothetical protein